MNRQNDFEINNVSVGQYLCPALKLEGGSPVNHQGEGSILGGQVRGVPHNLTVQVLVGIHCPCKQNQNIYRYWRGAVYCTYSQLMM